MANVLNSYFLPLWCRTWPLAQSRLPAPTNDKTPSPASN